MVVVVPTLERCAAEDALSSSPNVREIWNGGTQTTNGTINFSLSERLILQGVYGQQACLVAFYNSYFRQPLCITEHRVLEEFDIEEHIPVTPLEVACPITDNLETTSIVGRDLSPLSASPAPVVLTPVQPSAAPPAAPVIPPISFGPASRPLTRAQRLARALAGCRKKPKAKRSACKKHAERLYGRKRTTRR